MFGRKPASARTLGLMTFGLGLAFGAAVTWINLIPEADELPVWLALLLPVVALAFMGYAIAFTLAYWRRLDEAAREAHKWAWYWGGSLGIIPGFLFAVSGDGVGRAQRLGFAEPKELIEFGAVAVLASMIAGYLIAWGVWWLRKR